LEGQFALFVELELAFVVWDGGEVVGVELLDVAEVLFCHAGEGFAFDGEVSFEIGLHFIFVYLW